MRAARRKISFFINAKMLLIFSLGLFFSSSTFASDTLSYSGRLVNTDGSPVTGPVTIRAELRYKTIGGALDATILCTKDISGVVLTKGVFHTELNLDCGITTTLNKVLAQVPTGKVVVIGITHVKTAPEVSVSYTPQELYSVPFANLAKQLPQMLANKLANTGDFLKWNGSEWEPAPIVGGSSGTLTSIIAGTGLAGGTITTTGTLSIAAGGVGTTQLADGAVSDVKIADVSASKITGTITSAQILDGTIVNSDISAATIDYSKLNIGVGEIPQDRIAGIATTISGIIEDAINDATTTKAPSENAVFDALAGKAYLTSVSQIISTPVVTGLTTPFNDSDAANKKYVNDEITAATTSINTALSTSASGKVSKAGDTMSGVLTLNNASTTGEIHFNELAASGTKYTGFKSPDTLASTLVYTLPSTAPTAGQVLSSNAAGLMSWIPSGSASFAADVRAVTLSGLSVASSGIIAVGDSVLSALGNLQKQITDLATGAVGGDLSGNLPNPAISKLQGAPLTITTPATKNVLKYNGSDWVNSMIAVNDLSATGTTDSTTYLAGDNTWKSFNGGVIAAPLTGLSATGINYDNSSISASDTVVDAFNKLLFSQGDYISKTTNQTIYGTLKINSLTGFIEVPTPNSANEAANKGYVDSFGLWQQGTNTADVVRASGNVGIGTATPTYPLSIYRATTGATSNIESGNNGSVVQSRYAGLTDGAAAQVWGTGLNVTNGNGGYEVFDYTAGVSRLLINTSGNVGIGTSGPSAPLHVIGGGTSFATAFLVDSSAAAGGSTIQLGNNNISGDQVRIGVNGYLRSQAGAFSVDTTGVPLTFQISNVEKIRVAENGNVGIGTTTPAAKLDVSGDISVNSSNESAASYVNSTTTYTIPDTQSNIRRITLTGNATITLPAFATPAGKVYTLTLFLKQDETGSRTVTFAGNGADTVKWDAGATPTIVATAAKISILQFTKPSDETIWYASQVWKEE